MNLLFTTTHLPPDNHFGGVVQSGQALLMSLKKLISNITACCVSANPKQVMEKNIHNPVCTKTFIFHRWGFSPDFAPRFKDLAQKADIVVINGIMTYPMTTAGIISNNLNKPYIVSLRGGLLPRHMAVKSKRKKAFLRLFVRSILNNAAAIHATCEAEYNCAIKLGLKAPVIIVPNGTNLPPENLENTGGPLSNKLKSLSKQRLVLFMGRIEPIKGLDILLQSWADLTSEDNYKNVNLMIAGPDERNCTRELKSMTSKLGIADKVFFYGMVDNDSKWLLYKQADIFILPSYSENFGLVVAEALASGTPVITTTSAPWENLETYNAGKWVSPEKQSLTNALRQLLDMPCEKLRAMGKKGQKMVQEHYSWDIIAEKLASVYRYVLEKKDISVHP